MPSLTLPIMAEGAVVEVEVGWSGAAVRAARLSGGPISPPLQGRALLDTGAETSCVDSILVRRLGVPFGGLLIVNVPALGGISFSPAHDLRLTVFHPSGDRALDLVVSDLLVLDLDLATLGYQALLGRDFLAWFRLLYDGAAGRFKLRY